MERETLKYPINPYHFARYVIGGKWKMTILHDIHAFDSVRFNETAKNLQVSEKVLSKQLKELADDGLVTRVQYDSIPPRTEYFLTDWGKELIGALDLLYIWSVRRLHDLKLPIDPDAFYAHQDEKYVQHVGHIMEEQESEWRSPSRTPKLWPEEWHEQNPPDGKK